MQIMINGTCLEPVLGEQLSLLIVHTGSDNRQGVGYVSSGKVIARDGAPFVGRVITITVERVTISETGFVFFARFSGVPTENPSANHNGT